MPFRHLIRAAALRLSRPGAGPVLACCPRQRQPAAAHAFHSSRALRRDDVDDAGRSHYETLNVRPDASPAEIKRSFYSLSKAHHPDHNPSDPGASARFMRISAAYAVLSSPDKRAAYDRQHAHLHAHHRHAPHHKGSYSSTGPAGGRPASGLSRRRGTFKGPPPSFYRNGGWGAHSAKRAAAHEESTADSGTNSQQHHHHRPDFSDSAAAGGAGWYGDGGGMGPGDGRRHEDVPHFDRVSHERTHRRMERRRATDAAAAAAAERFRRSFAEPSILASFFIVSAVVLLAVVIPVMIFTDRERKGRRENDGKKVKKV